MNIEKPDVLSDGEIAKLARCTTTLVSHFVSS